MIPLVTLPMAKMQLRVIGSDSDPDILYKINQASDLVLSVANRANVEDWAQGTSPETYDIPFRFQTYALVVLTELYVNREASVAMLFPKWLTDLMVRNNDLDPGMA